LKHLLRKEKHVEFEGAPSFQELCHKMEQVIIDQRKERCMWQERFDSLADRVLCDNCIEEKDELYQGDNDEEAKEFFLT